MCFPSLHTGTVAQAPRRAGRLWRGLATLLLAVLVLAEAALAGDLAQSVAIRTATCAPADARGVQKCAVGLDIGRMARLLQAQRESQWCWAASIAMVFAGAGFEVSQEDVVRAQFGELLDLPVRARDMTDLLNRTWRDAGGRLFAAQVAGRRTDQDLRAATLEILRELGAGRPLVVGFASHAVVLARVHFERFTREGAVRIVALDVLDPAPGAGVRRLDPAAHRLTYLAAVQVAAPATDVVGGARSGPLTAPDAITAAGQWLAGQERP